MRSEASLATYPLITGIALRVAPRPESCSEHPPARPPEHGRIWPAGRRVVHRHDRPNTQYTLRGRPRRSSTTTTRRQ